MFGPGDAIRVNKLKESLVCSDEILKKKHMMFEECIGLLECLDFQSSYVNQIYSEFWAIHDAFIPAYF